MQLVAQYMGAEKTRLGNSKVGGAKGTVYMRICIEASTDRHAERYAGMEFCGFTVPGLKSSMYPSKYAPLACTPNCARAI